MMVAMGPHPLMAASTDALVGSHVVKEGRSSQRRREEEEEEDLLEDDTFPLPFFSFFGNILGLHPSKTI